ncbi:glycosyltransferase 61 family protein [Methylobacterium sp. Leaf118]|uniref:glycosyltransferase 61 family protein n=1 Tax=Methylobacterium sp. Leaf118 TaxID=2876562 RepID=UPI001E455CEF|nr:glycosyltransferase family 61 protein [Methylobacterium sp. Leaf118]
MGQSVLDGSAALRARARVFADILVHPSLEVLRNPRPLFRGGPAWPRFETQVLARTCWFPLPVPIDAKPPPCPPAAEAGEGVWCGPVSFHFGHMVADFGMRLAASSRAFPELPLVFSIWNLPGAEPLPFFWQIVDHLGIDRARIHLNRVPTLWRRLHVLPQAERRFGGGPGRAHLDFMDAITGPAPLPDLDCLFVSRAGLPKGRFAGEGVLEAALQNAGVVVFRPETVPLDAQVALYRRARRLIVSEGSALHAFQLLGRVPAEMIVLCRRPWRRMAAASLRPRVSGLHYVEALRGLVHGLRATGRPQTTTALSVLDEGRLLDALGRLGVPLAWDRTAYLRAQEADLADWIVHRMAQAAHPGERATIERCLRGLSLPPPAPWPEAGREPGREPGTEPGTEAGTATP